MPTWLLAAFAKPLFFFAFFVCIVAPASWLLSRIIPDGRAKQILFKERTRDTASRRDKIIMTSAVIAFYLIATLLAACLVCSSSYLAEREYW